MDSDDAFQVRTDDTMGSHTRVRVWNRHGLAGTLVVLTDDAQELEQRLTGEYILAAKEKYNAEISEFNDGVTAYLSGVPIEDEPDSTNYDVWKCGWAWAAFEPMKKHIAELEEQNTALRKVCEALIEADRIGSFSMLDEATKMAKKAVAAKEANERS